MITQQGDIFFQATDEWTTVQDWINNLDCPIEMRIHRPCTPKAWVHHEYLFSKKAAWLILVLGKISRSLCIEVGLSFWPILGERYTIFSTPWYRWWNEG